MFYTYMWLREDGTPYYIGKGKNGRAFTSRAHSVKRPPTKERVVIYPAESEINAFETEIALIWYYGRKDLGTGCLRNCTDGGEGTTGKPESSRKRISQALQGNKHGLGYRHSEDAREKISTAKLGNQNGRCNKGRKRGKPWNYGTARSAEESRLRHREADARYRARKRQT